MSLNPETRGKMAFGFAALAILLRLASDWLFSKGGPFPYQMLQAILLVLALVMLRYHLDAVFLKDGQHKQSIREGLLALPLGLLLGLGSAWISQGGLQLPPLDLAIVVIANNLFFPAVEELEFRGFLLGWLSQRKLSPMLAVFLVAILHMLAHPHYLWEGNYISALSVLLAGLWWGSMTLRTRSLWGAYFAHALFNITYFLLAGAVNR